eukprot:2470734-Amphidinium_carterae.1
MRRQMVLTFEGSFAVGRSISFSDQPAKLGDTDASHEDAFTRHSPPRPMLQKVWPAALWWSSGVVL